MNQYTEIPIWAHALAISYEELCRNSPLEELLGEENLLEKEWYEQKLDDFQKLMLKILRNEIRQKLK